MLLNVILRLYSQNHVGLCPLKMQIFSQVKFIRKNSLKFLCFLLIAAGGCWPGALTCRAGVRTHSFNVKPRVNNIITDTLPAVKDTTALESDTTKKGGGTDTLHIKYSKDTLDAAVKFSAKDSVVLSEIGRAHV